MWQQNCLIFLHEIFGCMALTPQKTPSDLQRSIERLKKELSSLPVDEEGREEKHEKRKRIVQLQLRLQRMKEVCCLTTVLVTCDCETV